MPLPLKDAPRSPEVPRPTAPRRVFLGFSSLVWAWAMYDLANTVFSALFVSVNYPIWIVEYAGGTKTLVGLTTTISCFASALVVPILGSISDRMGKRMPLLIAMTAICCAATPVGGYLPLYGAALAGGLAFFGYYTGLALYDAILPSITAREVQGRTSGLGIGLGYGGTIVALLVAWPINRMLGADPRAAIRGINWAIGILYMLFSLPLFFMLKERGSDGHFDLGEAIRASVGRVASGARLASRQLWTFIASAFFFSNAAMAVITFFGLYAREVLQIPIERFYLIYAVLAIAALVGAVVAGRVVDKIGPKPVLLFDALLWIGVLTAMMLAKTERVFVIAGIVGGAALGTQWTATRPMLIRHADPERMGETFGFLGMANSLSVVIGPFVFGALADGLGYTAALASLVGFFLVGIALLSLVPPQGRRPVSSG